MVVLHLCEAKSLKGIICLSRCTGPSCSCLEGPFFHFYSLQRARNVHNKRVANMAHLMDNLIKRWGALKPRLAGVRGLGHKLIRPPFLQRRAIKGARRGCIRSLDRIGPCLWAYPCWASARFCARRRLEAGPGQRQSSPADHAATIKLGAKRLVKLCKVAMQAYNHVLALLCNCGLAGRSTTMRLLSAPHRSRARACFLLTSHSASAVPNKATFDCKA